MLMMHLAYLLVQILSMSVATSLLFNFVKWLKASEGSSLCVASKFKNMCCNSKYLLFSLVKALKALNACDASNLSSSSNVKYMFLCNMIEYGVCIWRPSSSSKNFWNL